MRAMVLGATAGVGRALSEALAKEGYELLLVARDQADLEAQAAHLGLCHGVGVATLVADAAQPEECIERIKNAVRDFDQPDSLLFPLGASRGDDTEELSLDQTRRLFDINLLTIMGAVRQLLPGLLSLGKGNIVGFGSVAAARGRKSNTAYSAAKRGLQSYFESLRHQTAQSGVRVQFYQLGYVDTQQSFGQRLLFPPASPEFIARAVVRNLGRDLGQRHLPRYWWLITRLVSWLPWALYKRLDF